jgi:phage-related protein|nr:MAG TPA: tail tape measure protein [Caudoviricetes sp.]
MNLLDLMVKIGVDDQASGRIGSIASGITGTVGGIAKVGAAAFAAVGSAAVGATGVIAKQALDAYSSYEQNVGGIQKLFGNMGKSVEEYAALTGQSTAEIVDKWQTLEDSQNKVLANAQNAYKTAGLSANAYMEQVTSFSAALISSLGGDTVKAADYADIAMTDMSDNANTFGTAIGDIQNAYQGFAKQNYTMLDNLKLGYGGTQQEMQRLIADASKMTDVQQKLGVTVDSSSMSFDNIVAAIHVMQESMQIGGTTAREASTTIEGSVSSMKAAWDNWLVGLGSDTADISALTGQLVDSAVIAASNIVPRVGEIVGTLIGELPSMLTGIGPVFSEAMGTIGTTAMESLRASLGEDNPVVQMLDSIIEAASSLSGTFSEYLQPAIDTASVVMQALSEAFSGTGSSITDVLQPALDAFLPVWQSINDLIQAAVPLIVQIVGDVVSLAGSILEAAMPAITSIVETVSTALPLIQEIWNAVFPVIQSVTETVFGVISSVIQTVMSVIQQVISVVLAAVNGDWSGVWNGILGIAETVWNSIKGAVSGAISFVSNTIKSVLFNIKTIWHNTWTGVASFIVGAWENIKTGVSNGIEGVLRFVRNLPGNILRAIGNVGRLLWNAGSSIISGFLSGLKQKFEDVKSFVGGIGDWIVQHKGPLPYDRKLLVKNGLAVMQSLDTGLRSGFEPVMGYVSSMAGQLADAFGEPVLSATVSPMDYDTSAYKSAAMEASGGVTYNLYVDGLSVSTDGDMAEAVQEFARQIRRAASV